MKVIETRLVPVYEEVCHECKSKIQYKACEVSMCHIICPVCGVAIWANTIKPVEYVTPDTPKEDEENAPD